MRWRAYFTFVLSGIAGWVANTATLLVAAEVLALPVWLAKAFAVLASFVVNFSISHFVVFRVRPAPAARSAAGRLKHSGLEKFRVWPRRRPGSSSAISRS